MPFFHATGCFAILIPALYGGAKLVLMHQLGRRAGACELIERERVTQAGGVPTIAWQLLEHPARDEVRPLVARERRLWRRAGSAPELVRGIKRDLPEVAARPTAGA